MAHVELLMLPLWYWDPHPVAWTLPGVGIDIAWYGVFFALGLWGSLRLASRLAITLFPGSSQGQRAIETLSGAAIIGVLVGARLGHCLLYSPMDYLAHPWLLLDIRGGGLASHGGVAGLAVGLWLGARRASLPLLKVLDLAGLVYAPTAVAIRLGNFVNQEILGVATDGSWGVLFGHPRGGAPGILRHPAQLYEAVTYAVIGLILWWQWRRHRTLGSGRFAGMALTFTFAARWVLECWKEEQASWQPAGMLLGQWLSLPLIFAGLLLWWRARGRSPEDPLAPAPHHATR